MVFAVYTQLGLIPVAFALPDSKPSEFARRVKNAIGSFLFGTILGILLGLAVAWVAERLFSASATVCLQCWGYGMAISAVLFFLLRLFLEEWRRAGCAGREWLEHHRSTNRPAQPDLRN